jgi:hypothetical protein
MHCDYIDVVMRGHSASEDARERAYDSRIHLFVREKMDCRVKPGNDAVIQS